jgi:hypothetical protein
MGTDVGASFSTRETVDCDTPAARAMSCIVTGRADLSGFAMFDLLVLDAATTMPIQREESSPPAGRSPLDTIGSIALAA